MLLLLHTHLTVDTKKWALGVHPNYVDVIGQRRMKIKREKYSQNIFLERESVSNFGQILPAGAFIYID
jgi:hypothetical protein